jgi:hypothetical protein
MIAEAEVREMAFHIPINGKLSTPGAHAPANGEEALRQLEQMLLYVGATNVERGADRVGFNGRPFDLETRATPLTAISGGEIQLSMPNTRLELKYRIAPRWFPFIILTATAGVTMAMAVMAQRDWLKAAVASAITWASLVAGAYALIWWRFARWLKRSLQR